MNPELIEHRVKSDSSRDFIVTMLEEMGGSDGAAKDFVSDFRILRNVQGRRDELRIFEYHKAVINLLQYKDKMESEGDLGALTDDQLNEVLLPMAIKHLTEDDEFRNSAIRSMLKRDPKFLEKVLEVAEKVESEQRLIGAN